MGKVLGHVTDVLVSLWARLLFAKNPVQTVQCSNSTSITTTQLLHSMGHYTRATRVCVCVCDCLSQVGCSLKMDNNINRFV